jgi:hypothetical protein
MSASTGLWTGSAPSTKYPSKQRALQFCVMLPSVIPSSHLPSSRESLESSQTPAALQVDAKPALVSSIRSGAAQVYVGSGRHANLGTKHWSSATLQTASKPTPTSLIGSNSTRNPVDELKTVSVLTPPPDPTLPDSCATWSLVLQSADVQL